MIKRLLVLLVGTAAIVGWRSMFGKKQEFEMEIDPVSGRETLDSLITRAQNRLKDVRQ